MGRNENIKRMKRLRAEKKKRQREIEIRSELDGIAEEATNKLIRKLLPFNKITRNTGPVKYSEVLKDFVRPYLDECENFKDTVELFNVGAIAWNMASIKQFGNEEAYEDMIKDVEKHSKTAEGIDFLEELVDRKIKYFSHHKVTIHNVELTENETAFGVSVAVAQIDSGL
jgi:hypothetical protein